MPHQWIRRCIVRYPFRFLIFANQRFLDRVGYDILPKRENPKHWRALFYQMCNADLIFDVGANIGQFAKTIRSLGYRKRIVSFEPLSSAYSELQANSQNDPLWTVVNLALGDMDGNTEINIASRSVSSSLLDMTPERLQVVPNSATYIGKESIQIRRLDSIVDQYAESHQSIFLKMDVQGYENRVLTGAKQTLSKIVGIQCPMPLIPLYRGSSVFPDMISLIQGEDFRLMHIERGFSSPTTNRLLSLEGFFIRTRWS